MSAELTLNLEDPRDFKTYFIEVTPVRRVMTTTAALLFATMGTIHPGGVENLPASGPVILAANHLSNFDVFPMQFALPRPVFFMGKEELFRNPALDWLLRELGGFPVYRGASDEWAMRHAAKILDKGEVLGIFPEGKRSKGKGLAAGKKGAARLAMEMDCPVIPLAVDGTQRMLTRFPRRNPVSITLGSAIYPQHGEDVSELTDRIMYSLAALLPVESRGVYASRSEIE